MGACGEVLGTVLVWTALRKASAPCTPVSLGTHEGAASSPCFIPTLRGLLQRALHAPGSLLLWLRSHHLPGAQRRAVTGAVPPAGPGIPHGPKMRRHGPRRL